MKNILKLLIILLLQNYTAALIKIHCNRQFIYIRTEINNFEHMHKFNVCIIWKNLKIYHENEEIEMIGNDTPYKGFSAENVEIYYIPEISCANASNIKLFEIKNSRLKEIYQENFKKLTELIYLDLSENEIEFLEANLFQYNTKLLTVLLNNNRISIIEPNIFDFRIHTNLDVLKLNGNLCIDDSQHSYRLINIMLENLTNKCWTETSKIQIQLIKIRKIAQKNLDNLIINRNRSEHVLHEIEQLQSQNSYLRNDRLNLSANKVQDLINRDKKDICDEMNTESLNIQQMIDKLTIFMHEHQNCAEKSSFFEYFLFFIVILAINIAVTLILIKMKTRNGTEVKSAMINDNKSLVEDNSYAEIDETAKNSQMCMKKNQRDTKAKEISNPVYGLTELMTKRYDKESMTRKEEKVEEDDVYDEIVEVTEHADNIYDIPNSIKEAKGSKGKEDEESKEMEEEDDLLKNIFVVFD